MAFDCQCSIRLFLKDYFMFDKRGIYERFAQFFPDPRPITVSTMLNIHYSTAFQWKVGKTQVPWARMKKLVDEQHISWDWLIEGNGEKYRQSDTEPCQPFIVQAINERYFSLFPVLSQAKLGREIGVHQTTVFKWQHGLIQVPWARLQNAVHHKGVTWEWLLEGR